MNYGGRNYFVLYQRILAKYASVSEALQDHHGHQFSSSVPSPLAMIVDFLGAAVSAGLSRGVGHASSHVSVAQCLFVQDAM